MGEINYEQVIGLNIRKERIAKNWSQTELGNRCQIANTVISAYENGKKIPGLNTVVRIARELGISIDRLCYGDESEAFINSAPNKGRKIVNCFYTLWNLGVINYYENMMQGYGFIEASTDYPRGIYIYLKEYGEQIKRLIISLNEFSQKRNTFAEPDKYLEMLLSSISTEINELIEEHERLVKMRD